MKLSRARRFSDLLESGNQSLIVARRLLDRYWKFDMREGLQPLSFVVPRARGSKIMCFHARVLLGSYWNIANLDEQIFPCFVSPRA